MLRYEYLIRHGDPDDAVQEIGDELRELLLRENELTEQREEARALIRFFVGRMHAGLKLERVVLDFEAAVAKWEQEG